VQIRTVFNAPRRDTRIRKAFASDLGKLIELSRRTISASYRPFLGDVAVDGFLGGDLIDRYFEESIERCSVMLRDDTLVGFTVCQDNVIDLLMIDHAAHRQGLGTLLLKHLETVLFETHHELVLESFEKNEHANAFYRQCGWLEAGKRFDTASGANKILFRKSRLPLLQGVDSA
jgi:GNAT superfamily N-acetyltransferase